MSLLSSEQLDALQNATLHILEEVGVRFPSGKALALFADHGANVDFDAEIVRLPRELVLKAMSAVPRYFHLGARHPDYEFTLQDGATYFATDGSGYETVDFATGERRPSCKEDVAMMARVCDYLSSIAFYWPIVSAQDYERTAPLHELDASWNNMVKHIQTETVMGEVSAQYALEMATVITGDRETLREHPPFSSLVCTVAPLMQDKEGIEAALVFAEAGIPVGFLAMPTLGTTAPATLAGSLVVGDAEIISASVLMQLANPGAPVFHSFMEAWADPSTGAYVIYPVNNQCRYPQIELAHHWGMPVLGGAYGTEAEQPGTWRAAADVGMDAFLVAAVGAELVTGMGLNNTYTLLHPWAIIMDDELYHRGRYAFMGMETDDEALALDVIKAVGPGGHFLAQKHTRRHMRGMLDRGITHQLDENNQYKDPVVAAKEKLAWILENHHPEPLEETKQVELTRILKAADKELNAW
jgi:trimethylamine--corrinoid protein Co-methyltransferase